jgi:uncharacterized protein
MKLHPDKSDTQNIRGYGPGWIAINNDKLFTSLLVSSGGLRLDWECDSFSHLNETHFAVVAAHAKAMGAEMVIFGSGHKLRFVPPAWLSGLMAQRIGLETMDTPAACRTYNILAGEGRKVLAAIVLEQSEPSITP